MDLRNFETTSTYAIEAVYAAYFDMIPERYRVKDPLTKEQNDPPKPHANHPMTQKEVKEWGNVEDSGYFEIEPNYDDIDLTPWYDPELNFSDRFHYRLTNIDYPKRAEPWYIITWNFGKGILKSSLTNRRFDTATFKDDFGDTYKFKFQNVDMDVNLAFTSNSLQALFELQENIIIGRRLKSVVITRPHSILGKFPVSIDVLDSDITKYSRDKGTLCCLMLNVKVDFPVIGMLQKVGGGIIKEIRLEIDKDGTGPGPGQYVYSRDIINADTEVNIHLIHDRFRNS